MMTFGPHNARNLTNLTRLGVWTAHPAAFVLLIAYAAAWALLDLRSFDWHAVATLATWMMTLFIQRAEHRDTQAIHAKIDELLKVIGDARTDLRDIDNAEPEEIEKTRAQERQA